MIVYFLFQLNSLKISADVKAFHETMHAYHRLLDLQGKYANPQVLSVMVKGVVLNEMDSTGNPVSNLRTRLLELFGRVTASVSFTLSYVSSMYNLSV